MQVWDCKAKESQLSDHRRQQLRITCVCARHPQVGSRQRDYPLKGPTVDLEPQSV